MTTTPAALQIPELWHRFLLDWEVAKNYHKPYELNGLGGGTFRNPILDYLLPSLLYVKLVAILDEAIKDYLKQKGLKPPKQYKKDLNGRLEFLKDQGIITTAPSLHGIRNVRNVLAHEATGTTDWNDLTSAIATIESTLQHLGTVGPRRHYAYFGERSAVHDSTELGILCEQDFRFGVKCNGKPAMDWSFTRRTHKSS